MSVGRINAYPAITSLISWNGNDTAVATTEVISPFNGLAWGGSEVNVRWNPASSCNIRLLLVNLSANANTVNGATIRSEINGSFGNAIITVDQASGLFRDITNLDTLIVTGGGASAVGDNYLWKYTEGDNTVNCKCVGALLEMI